MTQGIGKLISILHRRAQSYYTKALREFGISSAEYPVLFRLQRQDGLTQDEIASDLAIDKSAVTRIVQSLCDKQLILRQPDTADRRCNRIWLTERGHAAAGPIQEAKKKWNDILLAQISEEEQELLKRLLGTMVSNADKWR